jgi:hypothetical protein
MVVMVISTIRLARVPLGIEDPDLVVDKLVRIVGEEWVHAPPGNPGRLRMVNETSFRGLRPSAAVAARTAIVLVTALLIIAGGIEDREVLSNRTGCLLRLRPGDRLVARSSLLLVSSTQGRSKAGPCVSSRAQGPCVSSTASICRASLSVLSPPHHASADARPNQRNHVS